MNERNRALLHGQKVIILIDEYDVPLENAYFCGFHDEMSGFIRSLFESALKTNPSLEFHGEHFGFTQADMEVRAELENLIAGGTIEKQIHEDITYGDIHESQDNLWNFLLFTGYLRWSGGHMEGIRQYASMAMPNEEVKYIYENKILTWFDKKLRAQDLTPFYQALEMGDTDCMEQLLTDILADTISFYDYAENYYHRNQGCGKPSGDGRKVQSGFKANSGQELPEGA